VNGRSIKGIVMNRKPAILLVAVLLAGCGHTPYDQPARGVEAVNVPVVTRADYVFDAAAPGGTLLPSEAARLNGWFQGLSLRYGDTIYVDGPYTDGARSEVASIAGNFGMLVHPGAPITQGQVPTGIVRVIVSRNHASVPDCPDWSRSGNPNYAGGTHPNFGCAINSNLATMIANPEDFIHGREGNGLHGPSADSGTASATLGNALSSSSDGGQATSSKGN
jgi:pilus assembly protein CpaD